MSAHPQKLTFFAALRVEQGKGDGAWSSTSMSQPEAQNSLFHVATISGVGRQTYYLRQTPGALDENRTPFVPSIPLRGINSATNTQLKCLKFAV